MTRSIEKQTKLRKSESRGNLAYINLRNAQIPEATRIANKKCRLLKNKNLNWSKHFCYAMDELTKEALKNE